MKRALISPNEKVAGGQRIAQVVAIGAEFEVAPPLFFVDVANNVTAEGFFYDGVSPQPIPVPAVLQPNPDKVAAIAAANQLAASGSAADTKAFAAAIAKIL